MFKTEKAAKSILILQKNGDGVKPPKQALLVNLPKLSNANEMNRILTEIDKWFQENKF